ncbi:MAG: NADH-quinone oxidoreductase subunit J [Elusimicrobia bacterium]|nr:NADH-quinone oxidoreductase subunit J [Elusimicrobiota bacterium]
MLTTVLFFVLSGFALAAALGVVLVRNTVYAALLLGGCLSMVGGLYALMGADFLFAAQILIYVGAIAILFLFVVLLAGRRAELSEIPFNDLVLPASAAAVVAAMLLAGIVLQINGISSDLPVKPAGNGLTTAGIGQLLLGPHALGMEILGIVLLVALVGASLLARGLGESEDPMAPVPAPAMPEANGDLAHGIVPAKEPQQV